MITGPCAACGGTMSKSLGAPWTCECGYKAHIQMCFDGEGLEGCVCGLGPDYYQDPRQARLAYLERSKT